MQFGARLSLLSVVLALGACSLPDMGSFRAPDSSSMFRKFSVTNYKDATLAPVRPEDLVDASGRCAGGFVAPTAEVEPGSASTGVPLQESGVPIIPAAVALEMSECDVVKRAGLPERVEIGRNDRNERTATLTYIHGQRPGIYHFADGRLKTMERAPEPPPQPKPARPTKRAPKAKQTVSR